MERTNRRFIKKVPPSGAAPLFKLTLPHQIVHTYLSHLIETQFELATSPDATNCWQGTIAPRRNKNRSEYTLQGWRLFAEAHGVQPGDQVQFELVSPKRLVVTVISTEETKLYGPDQSNATSAIQADTPSPDRTPKSDEHIRQDFDETDLGSSQARHLDKLGSNSLPQTASTLNKDYFRLNTPLENLFQRSEAEARLPNLSNRLNSTPVFPSTHPATSSNKMSLGQQEQMATNLSPSPFDKLGSWVRSGTSTPVREKGGLNPPVALSTPLPTHEGRTSDLHGLRGEAHGLRSDPNTPPSTQQLQSQMLHLKSIIQAQQADLHFYEARAQRAEYEASQIKLYYNEVNANINKQTRAVVHVGEALEKLISGLSSPELLMSSDRSTADKLVALQSDLFLQLQKLKSSLLHLMSLEM